MQQLITEMATMGADFFIGSKSDFLSWHNMVTAEEKFKKSKSIIYFSVHLQYWETRNLLNASSMQSLECLSENFFMLR
jgi:hypothetical protein